MNEKFLCIFLHHFSRFPNMKNSYGSASELRCPQWLHVLRTFCGKECHSTTVPDANATSASRAKCVVIPLLTYLKSVVYDYRKVNFRILLPGERQYWQTNVFRQLYWTLKLRYGNEGELTIVNIKLGSIGPRTKRKKVLGSSKIVLRIFHIN